jgi:hypothetical protein
MLGRMSPYELVAERSRALHLAVAERLLDDPKLVEAARGRVREWLERGSVARSYAEAWLSLLETPLAELCAALGETSERMHDLRQVSPFAGALDPRTRWRIHRQVGARSHASR